MCTSLVECLCFIGNVVKVMWLIDTVCIGEFYYWCLMVDAVHVGESYFWCTMVNIVVLDGGCCMCWRMLLLFDRVV